MDIKDYSPTIAISAQREIIVNQRVTIEYWRGQVAARDARIAELEQALYRTDSALSICGIGSTKTQLLNQIVYARAQVRNVQKGGGDENH